MGGNVQRKHERYPLKNQPSGRLYLRTGSGRHLVKNVRDISSSGISLSVDEGFSKMADVELEYSAPNGRVEVFGKVVWCAQELNNQGKGPYLLGIELLSPMMLVSVLLQNSPPKAKARA